MSILTVTQTSSKSVKKSYFFKYANLKNKGPLFCACCFDLAPINQQWCRHLFTLHRPADWEPSILKRMNNENCLNTTIWKRINNRTNHESFKGETSCCLTPRKWLVTLCVSRFPSRFSVAPVLPVTYNNDRRDDAEQQTHLRTHLRHVHHSLMLNLSVICSLVCHHVTSFSGHAYLTINSRQTCWDAGSLCLKWVDIKPNIRPISLADFQKNMLPQLSFLPHSLLCTLTHTEAQKNPPFFCSGREKTRLFLIDSTCGRVFCG